MKQYLIYDGRYHSDPERAIVMEICDTLKEAKENYREHGDDTVIEEVEENQFGMQSTGKTWD